MSISPKEFLQVAEQLHGDNEAANRTAASRAYYCAYHACKAKLSPPKPANQRPAGMHRTYINALQHSPSPTEQQIGFIMEGVYKRRIHADYKLAKPFPPAEANYAIRKTRQLLDLLPQQRQNA